MPETQAASHAEDTQTGIYGGVEKFMSTEAQKASEKAKEDIMGEGMPLVLSGTETAEVATETASPNVSTPSPAHRRHHQSAPSEPAPIVLSPRLLDMLRACDVSDADFIEWLNQTGQDGTIVPTEEQVLSAKGSRERKIYVQDMTFTLESHKNHVHECQHHGAVGSVLHVLHLDRQNRKDELREQRQDAAELSEKMDMEEWEKKLRMKHASKEAKARAKAAAKHNRSESGSDSEISLISDRATKNPGSTAFPLSMLDPEFAEKKEKEEILNLREDVGEAKYLGNKENSSQLSAEQLVGDDRLRIKAHLSPAEGDVAVAISR